MAPTPLRSALLLSALTAVSACASSSPRRPVPEFRNGLGPDLRVFSDSACLSPTAVRSGGLGALGVLVKGVAGIAVKSFGRFLEEAGSPEIETASSVHPSLFFETSVTERNPAPELNPDLRCLYIIRDGFQLSGLDAKAPPDLTQTWRRLGVTSTPSLYAMVRLDPAEDGSGHFKGSLLDFTVQRFARPGAEAGRDLVIILEFAIPSGGRQYRVTANGEIISDPIGPFARGSLLLPGSHAGEYLREPDLTGMETGWMTAPAPRPGDGQRAVNVYVDVVEMKKGNPFLADIGRFIQSEAIGRAVQSETDKLVNPEEEEARRAAETVQARKAQLSLVQKLEVSSLNARETLEDAGSRPSERLTAAQRLETDMQAIELRRLEEGWRGDYPESALAAAKDLASRLRQTP